MMVYIDESALEFFKVKVADQKLRCLCLSQFEKNAFLFRSIAMADIWSHGCSFDTWFAPDDVVAIAIIAPSTLSKPWFVRGARRATIR